MEFIGRKEELSYLEKEYTSKGARFVVVYGRRRVGKTTLIEKFIEDKERIYYLAAEEKDFQQIEEFKKLLARKLDDDFLSSQSFPNWKDLFMYLEKAWPKEKRIILAIDEVTFIIKSNPAFPSYLQKFWDGFLSKTNTFLILSGSLVGLIIKKVLEEQSPLYGRRTSQIFLQPFDLKNAARFMKGFSFEDKLRLYGTIGGVAKYLTLIESSRTFKGFLEEKFFTKEGFFYPEGLFILSQELKEPSTYVDIMKAIAFGNTKANEIANFAGIDGKKASSYLDILITLGFVKRIIPVTESEKRFRGGIYQINDPFLKFWHRFVYPNRSWIELRRQKDILEKVLPDFETDMGRVFENICMEYAEHELGFLKFGTWWGYHNDAEKKEKKAVEIDIVGIDEKKGRILFGECKWSEDVDGIGILNKLRSKAAFVEWNNENRKETYVVFAKSFRKKPKVEDVEFIDLKALEKAFSA